MEKDKILLKKIRIYDDNIQNLSLKQRKKKVIDELKENKELEINTITTLLQYNNINEKLIIKYINSLEITEAESELKKYSNFLSFKSIKDLEKNKFKKNLSNRKKSYKLFFMDLLFSLEIYDIKKFQAEMNTINCAIKETTVINNQPHDKDNYEALYYYICILF